MYNVYKGSFIWVNRELFPSEESKVLCHCLAEPHGSLCIFEEYKKLIVLKEIMLIDIENQTPAILYIKIDIENQTPAILYIKIDKENQTPAIL